MWQSYVADFTWMSLILLFMLIESTWKKLIRSTLDFEARFWLSIRTRTLLLCSGNVIKKKPSPSVELTLKPAETVRPLHCRLLSSPKGLRVRRCLFQQLPSHTVFLIQMTLRNILFRVTVCVKEIRSMTWLMINMEVLFVVAMIRNFKLESENFI